MDYKQLLAQYLGVEKDEIEEMDGHNFDVGNESYWVGNYDGSVALEKILLDVLEDKYNFPIIKSNNFGHTEKKTVIPVGGKVKIDTSKDKKIKIIENFMK